ncbi:MAG: Tic22 family protein, partial [Crinalium sp.]
MKSFVRWGATLGLVGTTLLSTSFLGNLQALALPAEQVIQKLQTIPVFTVTDAKGAPLVRSIKNAQNKDVSVAGIFISQRDAQGFV